MGVVNVCAGKINIEIAVFVDLKRIIIHIGNRTQRAGDPLIERERIRTACRLIEFRFPVVILCKVHSQCVIFSGIIVVTFSFNFDDICPFFEAEIPCLACHNI